MKFTFETPAPTLVSSYPHAHGPQQLDVPMFAAVRSEDRSRGGARRRSRSPRTASRVPIRAARRAPRSRRTSSSRAIVDGANEERAGRPLARVPRDAGVPEGRRDRVEIAAGHAVGRGPEHDEAGADVRVPHVPAAAHRRSASAAGAASAAPGMPFAIVFNNPLDADKFDEAQLDGHARDPGPEDRRRAAT